MDTTNQSGNLDKKALKAQKRAEKLEKLEAKKNIVQTSQPKIKKPTGAGYDPTEVEKYWTQYWLDNQSFLPKEQESKFMICIPPPNITGSLHIGHAMMISIEDSIVRYKRLNGFEVLYLPGLDHAGIATQNVVMKNLQQEKKEHPDRETFLKAAFEWSDKYSNRICEQFNRMGTSLDYSRKVFTLDKNVNRGVNIAFCTLYEKGLIYRDTKIVYWCGKLRTTLSDLEVNHKEVEGGSYIDVDGGKYKFGVLYYFKYYLSRTEEVDLSQLEKLPYVIVATTRPETIPGDSAICINPNDKRFEDIEKIFERNEVEDLMNTSIGDMKGKDTFINGKDASINGKETIIKGKDASINGKDTSINGKDTDINGKDTDINTDVDINEEMKMERKNKYKVTAQNESEISKKNTLFAVNPLTNEVIPVIFDTQADLSFGTGILKITPCHDPVDFKLGKKHGLKFSKIMDENNRITHPKYLNMTRFEARKIIVEELRQKNLLVKEENHTQILPFCSRSNDVIEPMIKEQWWCDCKGMAQKAIDGVKSGEIEIFPEEAKGVWFRWLENIRDWCLSRQLWWGHRIPAYKVKSTGEWIVAATYEEALSKAGDQEIEQDEDVLDTWFSSGLWPFSTLGWPDKTADLQRYFPNSLLETGSDILFFWVARMVMLSYELTGQRPFDRIFLHGIVRDAHGRKMSKSLGNVIDPLYVIDGIELQEMIENLQKGNLDPREVKRATDALKKDFPNGIPKCGADALRFTLLSYTNGMKDINLDIMRVQGYSRLCNKIYNAYKFIQKIFDDENITDKIVALSLNSNSKLLKEDEMRPHHLWILKKLNQTIKDQHRCFESYNFMMATQSIYQLFFDFCDNIIEVSKNPTETDKTVLFYVFCSMLKIFNPFMPFITEDIHFKLTKSIIQDYPKELEITKQDDFEDILTLSRLCRSKKSVLIENFDHYSYIKGLTKGNVEFVDRLEEGEKIGRLKFKVIED